MDKNALRKQILQIRNNVPPQQRAEKSRLLHDLLFNLDAYKEAERIFVYISAGSEVDTEGIIRRGIADGKTVAAPVVKSIKNSEMYFGELKSINCLAPGSFEIMEPRGGKIIQPDGKTVVLVPGIAFSRDKFRIGYGKGFYDRYLADKVFLSTIGLAFSFQIVNNIINEPYDIRLNTIISEETVL